MTCACKSPLPQAIEPAPAPNGGKNLGVEYRYDVRLRAIETFVNLMTRQGIVIPDKSHQARFSSRQKLDIKSLKESGIILSYTITKVNAIEEVVEQG